MVRLTQILLRFLPLSALLLAACATAPPGERAPVIDAGSPAESDIGGSAPTSPGGVEQAPPTVEVIPLERTAPPAGSPAVASLLGQAEAASRERDWSAAAVSLERGLRIEPRNPVLWNRLAEVRLQQGQFRQAEQLAAKSNSLAGGDRLLQTRNWRLIARARRQLGDEPGAVEAERRAEAFR